MKAQSEETKIVTVQEKENLWTVVRTYVNYPDVDTQYTLINENTNRRVDGPYRTTKDGLEKMFNIDIEKLFD